MDFWLMWYDNSFTVLLMVIGFLLVLFAQIRINSAYSKYRRIQNYKGLTGYEVAKTILMLMDYLILKFIKLLVI